MNNELVLVGKIIGVFGIKGELKVYSESDFIETRFKKGARLILKNKKTSKEVTVSSMRIHKKTILITIDNLFDINKVEEYVGYEIYANKEDDLELDEDEYYLDDLVGLDVYDEFDEYVGVLNDFIEVPQGYIMEIKNKGKKVQRNKR
jgi:16S rRNA processing protein RimM